GGTPVSMKRALYFGVLALTLVPQSAAACGEEDDCDISNRWQKFELTSTVVPTDGVLVFNGERGPNAGGMTDAEALAFVSAEVTADGQTIAGTLESDEGWRGVVWRPDAPLPAGASVSVILSVDNEALDPFDDCEV